MTDPTTNYKLPTTKRLRVAIVHDWFVGGGAERVVLELHKLYPEAPIYTSYCSDDWRERLDGKVITGFLQKWPFPALRKFVPFLRIWWFSQLNFDDYDLVISSSGAEAKGIHVGRWQTADSRWYKKLHRTISRQKAPTTNYQLPTTKAIHINYCHAPTHYYWSRYDEYLKDPGFGTFDPLARVGLKLLVGPLRKWDYKAAQRPDYIIANSNYTKEQIKKYYNRNATVIHPPVEIERFKLPTTNRQLQEPRRGFVTVGRQTPYKRIDLAVKACTNLGLPLVVLGSGPEHRKLQKIAGKSITFLKGKNDEEIAHYLKSSIAFIFPGLDDFGIVAVEAMAAGTPVIAYKGGGALDYVAPGKTGQFFEPQTVAALEKVLQGFDPTGFDPNRITTSAAEYSPNIFKNKIQKYISESLRADQQKMTK